MIREYVVKVTDTFLPGAFQRFESEWAPEQELIRCKDCVHRGKAEKCVLAAIAVEKDYPLFMLDNRGEWFCADGERSERAGDESRRPGQ